MMDENDPALVERMSRELDAYLACNGDHRWSAPKYDEVFLVLAKQCVKCGCWTTAPPQSAEER